VHSVHFDFVDVRAGRFSKAVFAVNIAWSNCTDNATAWFAKHSPRYPPGKINSQRLALPKGESFTVRASYRSWSKAMTVIFSDSTLSIIEEYFGTLSRSLLVIYVKHETCFMIRVYPYLSRLTVSNIFSRLLYFSIKQSYSMKNPFKLHFSRFILEFYFIIIYI